MDITLSIPTIVAEIVILSLAAVYIVRAIVSRKK